MDNKAIISPTDNLIKLQKKLKLKRGFLSSFVGLGILFIYLIYVFIYALGNGYASLNLSFLGNVNFLKGHYYFSTTSSLFDFSSIDSVYRFIVLLLVVLFSAFCSFLFFKFSSFKDNNLFRKKYFETLSNEVKINGIIINHQEKETRENEVNEIFNNMSLSKLDFKYSLEFSSMSNNIVMNQYTYFNNNENRNGLLVLTSLNRIRTHALIELRTFGEISFHQFNGLMINKYGFENISSLANFTCYTTLGQEIYLILDKKVIKAISNLSYYIKTDMIIYVYKDTLAIFLDGFKFNLERNLHDNIKQELIEKQSESITGLISLINLLINALNDEVSFAKEEKGNGILTY